MNVAKQEIPDHVKDMFSKIDLNLPIIAEQKISEEVEPKKPETTTNSGNPSGYSLDLEVNNTPTKEAKLVLNSDEQKVRLNLARSYIKIKDLETARILLTDLVELKDSADQEIHAQASSLLLEIS